jgi:hypothetical protein
MNACVTDPIFICSLGPVWEYAFVLEIGTVANRNKEVEEKKKEGGTRKLEG